MACSPPCEEEIKLLKALLDRNKQAFPIAAKTHLRNAILLFLFGVVFFVFARDEEGSFFAFLVSFGAIMVVGAIFSLISARKFGRAGSK